MSNMASTSYVCDTLPAPRLASSHPQLVVVDSNDSRMNFYQSPTQGSDDSSGSGLPQTSPRKLCVRHQRMADEGTNLKLQQSLDALPLEERQAVNAIWTNFSSSSHPRRALILQGLLTMCCFSQLSLLTEQLAHLIRIDPFTVLPREISLKILGYLDATSLCRAAQVTKKWLSLADDDVLWRGICEQHIGQKCHKCGWGLPVLDKKKTYRLSPCPSPNSNLQKRPLEELSDAILPIPTKKARLQSSQPDKTSDDCSAMSSCALLTPTSPATVSSTLPWKFVYSERMTIERNWRRGRCTVRTIKGHTDGVMCLQFSETLSHPQFPVLITGSYDRTARVWNMETGVELHCLTGHTRGVRALQFDEVKLITGSMDHTLKVWDWRRGRCIRTLTGHTEGVVAVNFDNNVLASGSADTTIKVWNLRTGGAFTLRGHLDWVNSVTLWDSNSPASPPSTSTNVFDVPGCAGPQIDPGKMLFSASDDGTIRLWDLTLRTCVRQFTGHVAQVQSMKLLPPDGCGSEESQDDESSNSPSLAEQTARPPIRNKPVLISGSLDNTVKIWDIETGDVIRTFFGHIEGVWAVASDKMRLVSGSHDRTIKVWSREEGQCTATLVGHHGAISCLALGEDKIVSGGADDHDIKIWNFSG